MDDLPLPLPARPRIALVAAVARDGAIGRGNALPWRLPQDLARFKALTMGHPVVMGRRTWDSLPERVRPLPGRRNVVLTRAAARQPEPAGAAERVGSVAEALALLAGAPRICVIGGAQVYAAFLPLADELLLTEVALDVPDADAHFPLWNRAAFGERVREPHAAADGCPGFAFVELARRAHERPG